jgi:hypothetical protein
MFVISVFCHKITKIIINTLGSESSLPIDWDRALDLDLAGFFGRARTYYECALLTTWRIPMKKARQRQYNYKKSTLLRLESTLFRLGVFLIFEIF